MTSRVEAFLTEDELPPSPNRTWPRRISTALAATAVVAGAWAGYTTVSNWVGQANTPVVAGQPVTVIVGYGDTLARVAGQLKDNGVITSASEFITLAGASDTQVQPGVYTLTTGAGSNGALQQLSDPSRKAADLVLPEGLTLTETLTRTAQRTATPLSQLQAATTQVQLPTWADSIEGLTYPATYEVVPGGDAQGILQRMVDRFNLTADELELEKRAKKAGYTPEEIMTIASLVQAEGTPQDFDKVSAVIHNRLKKGMKLQFDSTVNYILGTNTFDLDATDTSVDSPYNTYLVAGLPPGPINSPGQDAIEAALDPANGEWLYFVTVDPERKITKFTAKYKQFLKWKNEFWSKYGRE